MRVPHAVGKSVLLFLILLGLNGCIQSDKNLLSDTETVTPLPNVFSLVALDKNNGIAFDKNGNTSEYDFVLTSSSYIQTHSDGNGLYILSLYSISASNTYLIGLLIKDKATGHIADVGMYTIASLIGDTLTHFEFSNKTLIDDLKRAGIEVDERAKGIKVNSKDQIILVAQLMEKRVRDADEAISYRIVASDQQRVTLTNDIKAAHLKWFASKPEV
jgi:hypothetical protein